MINWAQALAACHTRGEAHVIVTLLASRGSTPREAGTKMIVTAENSIGTIGGGHLEFQAIHQARSLLSKNANAQHIEHYPLAQRLGQCCGGTTTVLFECFKTQGVDIAVCGAGHVGQALVTILAQLPCRVHWIDNRAEQFPINIPNGVHKILCETSEDEINDFPAGSFYIVLTHNHQLDYALVEKVLARGDAEYLGVIGSKTKAKRFQQRLSNRGFSPEQIHFVKSPIGLTNVPGKHPMEVAVSIAAEVIGEYHRLLPKPLSPQQLSWPELQQTFAELNA